MHSLAREFFQWRWRWGWRWFYDSAHQSSFIRPRNVWLRHRSGDEQPPQQLRCRSRLGVDKADEPGGRPDNHRLQRDVDLASLTRIHAQLAALL
jgi:hypothetical protein